MGWSSGTSIMQAVIEAVQENVGDPDKRYYIYETVVDAMRDADWDTLDECLGMDEEYDRLYTQMFGEEEPEEDE